MNCFKTLYTPILLLFTFLFSIQSIKAQQVNTDSLLSVILQDMKNNPPHYELNVQRGLLGKKIAPEYLDFYLLLGRNHELLQHKDSARYYYNYVIEKNPKYEDAFTYLINLELIEKNYVEGEAIANKAIELYPDNRNFRLKRIAFYSLQNDTKNEEKYLKSIKAKFPNDPEIQQLLNNLYAEINSDKIGIYYNITSINRDGVGPWHLGSVNYIRQRHWGSLIGRISYANRYSYSESITNGLQYEVESYINMNKKSYSYFDAAYSPDMAFPKLRLAYSYFYHFKNGWEADLGLRYIKTYHSDFKTFNIGIGKYIGSAWLNFRTYIQKDNPAFLFNTRYYFKSKYDYVSLFGGYGTSPDDRSTLGQYEQREELESYRIGAGYSVTFLKNYIGGFLVSFNKQEYVPSETQNELEFGLSLQYKF